MSKESNFTELVFAPVKEIYEVARFDSNTLSNNEKPEAVGQGCSMKKVFLEISQIHRKAPVPESHFLIKLQA